MSTIVPVSVAAKAADVSTTPASPAQAPTAPAPQQVATNDPAGPGFTPKSGFVDALNGIKQQDPNAVVSRDRYSKAANFYSGAVTVQPEETFQNQKNGVSQTFLDEHGKLFGLGGADTGMQLVSSDADELGIQSDKYQEMYKGLPVFGQQLVVHSKGNTVTSATGNLTPGLNLDVNAQLTSDEAVAKAAQNLQRTAGVKGATWANGTLGVYSAVSGDPRLVYQFDVTKGAEGDADFGKWRYIVDANTGRTISRYSTIESALNRQVFDAKNGEEIPTTPVRTEGQPDSKDPSVNEAYNNAKDVYDFYKDNFGRDSIDGKGMDIDSVVHWGQNYDNAYWDGSRMTYGDGDGTEFTDFAKGVDVVGHEMTHGVTENSSNLTYNKQPGALNESWSDAMGEFIQRWAFAKANPGAPDPDPGYLIGEDIFTPNTPGDALRSMSNPGHAYPGDNQPDTMSKYVKTYSDNGGVHTNSGIPNKAAYLVAKALGDDKAAAIWYRTDTKYLTPNSQFQDAANDTVQAAIDLYGNGSEAQSVRDAWKQVGLTPKA